MLLCGLVWNLCFFSMRSKTSLGVLDLAMSLVNLPTANRTFNDLRKRGFIQLTDNQKLNLNDLKSRLGVNREIKIVWPDCKSRAASLKRKFIFNVSDEYSIGCYGCSWPSSYPAIIEIRNHEVLENLENLNIHCAHTTKLLHEIAHIKRKDGCRGQFFVGACVLIIAVVSAFFLGRKTLPSKLGIFSSAEISISASILAGCWLSNLAMGIMTLRKEQQTEEMAMRASTISELGFHQFANLCAVSCDTPYWKLPFLPSRLWRDPSFVTLQKARIIRDEKIKLEHMHQMI